MLKREAVMINCQNGCLMLRPGMGWILRIDDVKDKDRYFKCCLCKADILQEKKYYCKTHDLMFCEKCDKGGAHFRHPLCFTTKKPYHEHFNVISIQIVDKEEENET